MSSSSDCGLQTQAHPHPAERGQGTGDEASSYGSEVGTPPGTAGSLPATSWTGSASRLKAGAPGGSTCDSAVEDPRDVRGVHHREGLAFGVEARDDLRSQTFRQLSRLEIAMKLKLEPRASDRDVHGLEP